MISVCSSLLPAEFGFCFGDNMKAIHFFLLLSLFLSSPCFANLYDLGGDSGFNSDNTGNFYRPNSAATTSAVKSGTSLNVTEPFTFATSNGNFKHDLQRTVPIDLNRIGKGIRSVAVASGPVGLTISAVSLVCELTSICETAGEWLKMQVDFGGIASGNYPTCQEAIGLSATANWQDCTNLKNAYPELYWFRTPATPPANANCINRGGTSWTYTVFAYTCGNPPRTSSCVTTSHWDTAEPLLNDYRFVEPMLEKKIPVPVSQPQVVTPQKVQTGTKTSTTKDAAGNTTGTETTTSEAEITTPSPAENPSGNPNIIKITETSTSTTYNSNNQVTNSTTTVVGGTTQQVPQSYEIETDNITAQPLEERAIPYPFDTQSWGSGTCPADRTASYHYGTLNLTFQPACDFAEGIRPIVIILAGFIAMFIITGAPKDA